ncbi:MAG: hypothetical protein LUQ11_09140, partial [Methylococcaceae bacterium]|nr:hypothetical protein [Methylococcaceae bacterium]
RVESYWFYRVSKSLFFISFWLMMDSKFAHAVANESGILFVVIFSAGTSVINMLLNMKSNK